MNFFDAAAFIADALQREKERVIAEIDLLIEDARAGRAFPGRLGNVKVPPQGGSGVAPDDPPPPDVERMPPGGEEEVAKEATPDADGLEEGPDAPFADYHGRDRESFENRRQLALQALSDKGGEAPFSVIAERFVSVGLSDRKARSALDSLRTDEKAYNVKRTNPSDNTWALWDHPNAVAARQAERAEANGYHSPSFNQPNLLAQTGPAPHGGDGAT